MKSVVLIMGKGSWIDFGKATQWEFQDGTCSMYLPEMEHIPENLIWTIEFCEDKKNIPQNFPALFSVMPIIMENYCCQKQ